MQAPELPVDLGWYNPTHVIASRMTTPFTAFADTTTLIALRDDPDGQEIDRLDAREGDEIEVLEVVTGEVDDRGTGADATEVWYRFEGGWLRAWEPFDEAVQADGRAASLRPVLIAVT